MFQGIPSMMAAGGVATVAPPPPDVFTAIDRGTGTDTSAGTTLTIHPGGNMANGSTGILVLAMDNANGATGNLAATFYDDSKGNRWYMHTTGVGGSANTNAEGAILSSTLGTIFNTSDTLTVTFNASTAAKAWTWIEAQPQTGNGVLFFSHGTTPWGTSSGSGTPSITSSNTSIGDLLVGAGANEPAVGNGDTWVGVASPWSTKQSTATGTGTSAMAVISQWQIKTSYGASGVAYNPTLTASDNRIGFAVFNEADPKARIIGINTTSQSTTTATFTLPMAIGSCGVLCIAADNNGTGGTASNFPSSLTDSKSNTWTLRQNEQYSPTTEGTGVELAIYTSVLSTPLVVGDTVGWTYSTASVTAKCWVVWEFAPVSAGVMSYVGGAIGAGATTGSPTITTSSIPNGDYVVGVVGLEGANSLSDDATTSNGVWKTSATTGMGSGTTGMSIISQWKKVTAGATQTYNPTCTSGDTLAAWVQITET